MNAVVTVQTRVEDYLAERRRLGYHLRSTGLALKSFARYVDSLELAEYSGPIRPPIPIESGH
jgi:hypothetical protein